MVPPLGQISLPLTSTATGLSRQRETGGTNVPVGSLLLRGTTEQRPIDSSASKTFSSTPTAPEPPPTGRTKRGLDELLTERGFGHLKPLRGTIPRATSEEPASSSTDSNVEALECESSPPLSRVSSSPSFTTQYRTVPGSSEPSLLLTLHEEPPTSPIKPQLRKKIRSGGMPSSVSAPNLQSLADHHKKKPTVMGLRSATTLSESSDNNANFCHPSYATTNPDLFLRQIIESQGRSYKTHSSLSLNDQFFLEIASEHIAAYTSEVIAAVREANIDALHCMHHEGKLLQCCNKFGESIVHMACRKGSLEVVKFLLEQARVSLRVRDDYGRTPLHDAFWTQEPQPELVKLVIETCPDLLLCTDKRGFTPLSYVRRDHWATWCRFLDAHRELVLPRELL